MFVLCYTRGMKTFEETLDLLNDDHTPKLEKAFEKSLVKELFYYYENRILDLDDASFIPIFTTEMKASGMGIDDAALYANLIQEIPNPNILEFVINPLDQAIVVSPSIWLGDTLEVIGANTRELLFMTQSKDIFEAFNIKTAYVVNLSINAKAQTVLILDTFPIDEQALAFMDALNPLIEKTSISDIYTLEDASAKALVQGLKPYYKQ